MTVDAEIAKKKSLKHTFKKIKQEHAHTQTLKKNASHEKLSDDTADTIALSEATIVSLKRPVKLYTAVVLLGRPK